MAASTFARGYLNGLMDTVFDKLDRDGYFYDPVQREVETDFMPWLRYEGTALNCLKGIMYTLQHYRCLSASKKKNTRFRLL